MSPEVVLSLAVVAAPWLLAAVLVFLGRSVFWLALAALGVLLAWQLAIPYLPTEGHGRWLAAGLCGVLGAGLAIALRRVAVPVAGAVAGLLLGAHTVAVLRPDLGAWELAVWAGGALLGGWLATVLVEVVIAAASSIAGALVIAAELHLEPKVELLIVAATAALGVAVQLRPRNGD